MLRTDICWAGTSCPGILSASILCTVLYTVLVSYTVSELYQDTPYCAQNGLGCYAPFPTTYQHTDDMDEQHLPTFSDSAVLSNASTTSVTASPSQRRHLFVPYPPTLHGCFGVFLSFSSPLQLVLNTLLPRTVTIASTLLAKRRRPEATRTRQPLRPKA